MTASTGFSIRTIQALLVFFLVLAFSADAGSHVPIMEDKDTTGFSDAIVVSKPLGSNAIYADISSNKDVDFYSLDVKKPMKIHAGILVPLAENYHDFYPVYAVVGPGLPVPSEKLPFELPEGCGTVVMKGEPLNERPVFLEHFSGTRYYRGVPDYNAHADQTGTYYFVVWHPDGENGSYTFVYGRAEKWGIKDIRRTFKAMKKIKSGEWILDR